MSTVPGESGSGSASGEPSPLEDLLARALELQEAGQTVDLTELCRHRPELRGEVEAALARQHLLQRAQLALAGDPALGHQLAERYRLEARIGAGAMGVVYAAVDQRLDREVAVKVLRRDLVVGARMDQRLAREAKALARIRHPNVVTVHDSGQAHDGRSFVVMTRLNGCSIGQLLAGADAAAPVLTVQARLAHFRSVLGDRAITGGSDVRVVVEWMRQAADGLHAAHVAGVVHRDIKPSNLFVEASGNVVVLDFGIVSVDASATIGGDGSPVGTPAYMAPEQIVAAAAPNARSDVYGLAATLYHLLTGRPPFRGTIQQVLHAVGRQEPEPADRVRPGLPADLVAIVEKGMAKEPARRYASAAEFGADLVAWLEHRPVTARRASWLGAGARRLVRSPAARAVAAVFVTAGIAIAAWQWSEARAADRRARFDEKVARVPPSLVNDMPHFRETNALRKDPDLARLLDELVELAEEPTIMLAVRAMHRADCGQFALAADDVRRIVAEEPAPFARAALARLEGGKLADDLAHGDAAPAVDGPGDRCLLVLHAMRSVGARPAWVEAVLEANDGLARHALFAELHLLLRQRRGVADGDFVAQVQANEAIERTVIELETRRGRTSGILCQVKANALQYQSRMQEAYASALRGSELAPGDFSLRLLTGTMALRCGHATESVGHLRKVTQLQARSSHACILLSDALLALEDFTAARQVIDAAPFEPTDADREKAARQKGLVALAEHIALRRRLEPGDAAAAATSLAMLKSAESFFKAARGGSNQLTSLAEAICASLLDPSFSRRDLLLLLAESPLDGLMLWEVAELLPESLDDEETKALVQVLRAQATALIERDR